jgi:hypothetical protein
MDRSDPHITDIALIANLDTLGPVFVANANIDFFSLDSQSLFASRIVILTGMGNQNTPLFQIQGPIPISEIPGDEYFECYLFQMRPKSNGHSNLHLIVTFVFKSKLRVVLKQNEEILQNIMNKNIDSFDFKDLEDGSVPPDISEKYHPILLKLLDQINEEILQSSGESSLFDISFVSSLEEKYSIVAKKFLLRPDGIPKDELMDFIDEINYLISEGLIIERNKDGVIWYQPR